MKATRKNKKASPRNYCVALFMGTMLIFECPCSYATVERIRNWAERDRREYARRLAEAMGVIVGEKEFNNLSLATFHNE